MVDVAQLVEPRIVIPVVAGSIPVVHPSFNFGIYFCNLTTASNTVFVALSKSSKRMFILSITLLENYQHVMEIKKIKKNNLSA